MAKIDSNAELNEAILVLESKQQEELKRLKKEFYDVKERLQPKNLIKEGLNKFGKSSTLRNVLILAGVGVASGIAIKKVRSKRRRVHAMKFNYNAPPKQPKQASKISTSIIKYIIAAIISQNSDKIRAFIHRILSRLHSPSPSNVSSSSINN